MSKGKTTIQVSYETLDLIKSIRLNPRESYDEAIIRLIRNHKAQQEKAK